MSDDDLDRLGGRALEPRGRELFGGYPLSEEARMVKDAEGGMAQEINLDAIIRETMNHFAGNYKAGLKNSDKACMDYLRHWCSDEGKIGEYLALYESLKVE